MASLLKPQLPLTLPNKSRPKTLPSLATPQRTFISKADRFMYQYQDSPGPGSYDSPPPQPHTHRIPEDSPHLIIPKQHQWITSKGRQPFQLRQTSEYSWEDQDGSGSEKKDMGRPDWSKNARFDYAKMQRKSNVGPGKYSPERGALLGERANTLPLQRASPATYLKEILQQSRKRMKEVPELEEELLNLKMEAISVQRQTKNTNKKQVPSANFKSNSKRLYSQRQLTDIGPGAYDLQSSPGENSNNNPDLKKTSVFKKNPSKPPIPIHQRTKSSSLLADMATRQDNPLPGPGAYQLQTNSLKKAALGSILKQQRFIARSTQGPGPGQYMRKRFVHVDPNELQQKTNGNPFTKLPEVRPTFGTTERFGAWQTKEVPFGEYELTYEDISQRALRLRRQGSKSRIVHGKVSEQKH